MKLRFIFCVIIGTLLSLQSCEKDIKIPACGYENPLNEIAWLKDMKDSLEADAGVGKAEIKLYSKENSDYFVVLNSSLGQDFPYSKIYNCDGVIEYICGGNQPQPDSCSIFFNVATMIETIWEK